MGSSLAPRHETQIPLSTTDPLACASADLNLLLGFMPAVQCPVSAYVEVDGFLYIEYDALRKRTLEGGTDE